MRTIRLHFKAIHLTTAHESCLLRLHVLPHTNNNKCAPGCKCAQVCMEVASPLHPVLLSPTRHAGQCKHPPNILTFSPCSRVRVHAQTHPGPKSDGLREVVRRHAPIRSHVTPERWLLVTRCAEYVCATDDSRERSPTGRHWLLRVQRWQKPSTQRTVLSRFADG